MEEVAGKSGAKRVPGKVDEKAAANNAESVATRGRSASKSNGVRDSMLGRRELTFLLIRFVSSVQPWLLFCRERFESFSANAQSFSFAVQLSQLS